MAVRLDRIDDGRVEMTGRHEQLNGSLRAKFFAADELFSDRRVRSSRQDGIYEVHRSRLVRLAAQHTAIEGGHKALCFLSFRFLSDYLFHRRIQQRVRLDFLAALGSPTIVRCARSPSPLLWRSTAISWRSAGPCSEPYRRPMRERIC